MGADVKEKVKDLERQKEAMILRYMGLQDQADALNESIYHLCCDIEVLNKRIEIAREEERKAELAAQARAAAGKVPVNGNGQK